MSTLAIAFAAMVASVCFEAMFWCAARQLNIDL